MNETKEIEEERIFMCREEWVHGNLDCLQVLWSKDAPDEIRFQGASQYVALNLEEAQWTANQILNILFELRRRAAKAEVAQGTAVCEGCGS